MKDRKALQIAARALLKHGERESAKEVLLKIEDWQALISVHVEAEAWGHAFMTAKRCPDAEPALHEAHAEWLLAQDRCVRLRHVNIMGLPGSVTLPPTCSRPA